MSRDSADYSQWDRIFEPDGDIPEGVPLDLGVGSEEGTVSSRSLGVLGMVSIGFFWVCGGYGTEPLIAAAPPGVVAIALLIVPFTYALPVAFMVGELATAIPEDGGCIVWISRAFGAKMGLHNAWWTLCSAFIDSALYPVLASHYILTVDPECANTDTEVDHCFVLRGATSVAIVVFVTAIKCYGLALIIRFSTLMAILSLVPLLGFCVGGARNWDLEPFRDLEGSKDYVEDWPLFMSLILWLNCGFFGIGALAGQVKLPIKRTYSYSIFWLLIGSSCVHFLPILTAISQDEEQSNYQSGYFATLASKDLGAYMINAFQIGATLSMVGLYNAQSMQSELTMAFMLNKMFPVWTSHRVRGGGCMWRLNDGISKAHILLNALIMIALVWLPYDILLEGSMLIGGLPMFMTILAFFKLRVSEPKLYRPFKACNNICLAALMMSFPASALAINTVLNLNPAHDNFMAMASLGGGSIAFALIVHVISLRWKRSARIAPHDSTATHDRAPLVGEDLADSYT